MAREEPDVRLPAPICAVTASLALAVMPASPQDVLASPVGPGEADGPAAIHWQTDRVDLYADGLTLQLGDEAFSTEGAAVSVTEVVHNGRYWTLIASWTAEDHAHTLALNFRSNDRGWRVESITWLVSGIALPDGRPGYGVVSVGAANPTRTPPGQELAIDLMRSKQGDVVPCDATEAHEERPVSASAVLAFEGLRVSVTPRERSLLDKLLRSLGFDEPFDLLERVC